MNKKEVIYYEGNSFPSPGPEILELKADNKGSVIEEGMGQGLEVQLTERGIKNFWKKMDEIGVWNWEKNYSIGEVCDGHMWKLHLRNKEGKAKVVNGHSEYPHHFDELIIALNNLFGSKIETIEDLNTDNEVVQIRTEYYGGGQYILLDNDRGLVSEHMDGDPIKVKIDEFKKQNFWKKLDELGVWNWHSKYPHKQPKYQSKPDMTDWELKIVYHDKAKYCSGYDSFPKNFKKFIKELSNLMGVEFKIE